MHVRPSTRRAITLALGTIIAGALAPAAHAAAPPPCGGAAQVSDDLGDGHHSNTDVVAAWFAESASGVQAVIQVRQGVWGPAHDDTDAAGFALLYRTGDQTRYVRVEAPRSGTLRFDHGTWSAGVFASAGTTSGTVEAGTRGTATIDVPAAAGATAGAVLASPWVLTYDGGAPDPHWVDRAPGGTTPSGVEFGADFVVGSCSGSTGTGDGGGTAQPGGAGPGGPGGTSRRTVTAVHLRAPRRVIGTAKARVEGRVLPGREGIVVELRREARARTVVQRIVTGPGGTFFVDVPIPESTRLRASADGLSSETRTVTLVPRVRMKLTRVTGGGAHVTGTVSPALSGRILLLRTTSPTPAARTSARGGRFRITLRRPRTGRYQVVFIPSGGRAERVNSNTGALR